MGRSDWHGLWAGFKLDANCSHKMAKKRNFNTLIILYMYIPQIPIKIFPKKAGYAREYPGTTVGPSMAGNGPPWNGAAAAVYSVLVGVGSGTGCPL